ncbi:hypothetical protein [Burkholderia ubonensis]|uniref:hypothetical protein n=1 Tax=Burkholderia ubonensis TaxID=101571 RepID=UPI000AB9F680|nr:hypothetical protein [Burkholderia ubonensis]
MAQFSATVKTTIGSAGKFRRMYPNVRNPPPCLSPSNMKLATSTSHASACSVALSDTRCVTHPMPRLATTRSTPNANIG